MTKKKNQKRKKQLCLKDFIRLSQAQAMFPNIYEFAQWWETYLKQKRLVCLPEVLESKLAHKVSKILVLFK